MRVLQKAFRKLKSLHLCCLLLFFLNEKKKQKKSRLRKKRLKTLLLGRKKKNSPYHSLKCKSRRARTVFSSKDRPKRTILMHFSFEAVITPCYLKCPVYRFQLHFYHRCWCAAGPCSHSVPTTRGHDSPPSCWYAMHVSYAAYQQGLQKTLQWSDLRYRPGHKPLCPLFSLCDRIYKRSEDPFSPCSLSLTCVAPSPINTFRPA